MTRPLKLLVVGIDGASASVVDDLIDRELLPNFKCLRECSASGVLQSTFPPHTAPGWASMFTGVEPGEHGIYQFWSTKSKDYQARGRNVSDYGREPIWIALERHGLGVGVCNVPMSHPPVALQNGYMISWPLSPTLRYTEPPELMQELARAKLHYHSDIVTMYRGQPDYLEQANRGITKRAETCVYLQESRPVDALFVVFTEIDRVSHYFWGEDEKPAKEVEHAYCEMDRALAHLMNLVDKDTLLVVASDHGFGRCTADLNIHEVLEKAGLLTTKFVPELASAGLASDDTSLGDWFESTQRFRRTIDWKNTLFYMPTPGCFGLNANLVGREDQGAMAPADLDRAEQALRDVIANLVDDEGRQWFDLIESGQIYRGGRSSEAPDYLLVPRDFSVMPTPNLAGEPWSAPSQSGVHRPDGIILVSGPTFPTGASLVARVEDVYATILAHLGVPVPLGIDGHWLVHPGQEIRREQARSSEAGRALTVEESSIMDRQLQAIGYLK